MTACLLWTHFDHLPPSWCLRPQRVNKPRASKFPVTETAWGIRIRGGSGIGPTFAADEGGANVSQRGRAIQKERLLANGGPGGAQLEILYNKHSVRLARESVKRNAGSVAPRAGGQFRKYAPPRRPDL